MVNSNTSVIAINDVKSIFEEMFKQHEIFMTKRNEEMFKQQENSLMQIISGNTQLTNQRLDALTKDITDLKESLQFTQNEVDDKFKNLEERVKSIESELKNIKDDVQIIQSTQPNWALDLSNILTDLEDHSRRNNLRIDGVKEHKREAWEDCSNKVYDLIGTKLQLDTGDMVIERAHRTGKKDASKDKPRTIIVQFNSYRDKIRILKNCKKLKGSNLSIYEDFSKETMEIRKEKWKEVMDNRRKGKISYLQYRTVIC